MIKQLQTIDLDAVLNILKQEPMRGCDGRLPDSVSDWISHFITDDVCFAFGLFETDLISVLLAEKLSDNGCLLWYIATRIDKQGQGYGSELLTYFESYAKRNGTEWIFLNATDNSLRFYAKHNFVTSSFSKVYEHVKNL